MHFLVGDIASNWKTTFFFLLSLFSEPFDIKLPGLQGYLITEPLLERRDRTDKERSADFKMEGLLR